MAKITNYCPKSELVLFVDIVLTEPGSEHSASSWLVVFNKTG